MAGRQGRGIDSRLKQARFTWLKTLEQVDFDFQPSVDANGVQRLAGPAIVERAEEEVVLLGPPGVGKTSSRRDWD